MRIDLIKKYHIRYFHITNALKSLREVNRKVLDVGCGRGEFTNEIKKERPELNLYRCDFDSKLLKYMKENFGKDNVKTALCNAHKLSYVSKSFDAVVMFDILGHLKNPKKVLSEISRVLKKGGTLYLVVPCEADLHTLDGWIKKLFGKNLKEAPIGHIQQFTLEEVEDLLEKADFKVKKIRFSYHFLYQFFSLLYFSYVAVFRKGEYLALGVNPHQTFLNKILLWLKALSGWLVYFESNLLFKVRGQTAHVTSTKK